MWPFNRHKHRWELLRVQHGVWKHDFLVGSYAGGAASQLYWRCSECNKLETTTLNGHWTKDEIEGR